MDQLVITSGWSQATLAAVIIVVATVGGVRPLDRVPCITPAAAVAERVLPGLRASAMPRTVAGPLA